MADVIYFVDAENGDDGDAGTESEPLKTISAAFSKVNEESEDTFIIKLAGTVATPQTYTEASPGYLDLSEYKGEGSVLIQPAVWDQTKHDDQSGDPCGGSSFDPEGPKPCSLPSVKLASSIQLRGVAVKAAASPAVKWGVLSKNAVGGFLTYCRVEGHEIGLSGLAMSASVISDCCFVGNRVGVSLQMAAAAALLGRNVFLDNLEQAIRARMLSVVAIGPGVNFETGQVKSTTAMEIRTTTPSESYTAVKLEFFSHLLLRLEADLSEAIPEVPSDLEGFLKIINASGFDDGNYAGVSLTTHSMVIGSDNVFFYESGLNGGAPTVPTTRQFVQREGHATVVVP